jgi:hypothetical protein
MYVCVCVSVCVLPVFVKLYPFDIHVYKRF